MKKFESIKLTICQFFQSIYLSYPANKELQIKIVVNDQCKEI